MHLLRLRSASAPALAIAGLLAALTSTASAQSLFYGAASGNWDNAVTANWGTTSSGPFNTVWSNDNTANFSNQTGNITVTLSGAKTVDGITVGSGGAVTLSNSAGGENLITFNSGAIIETNQTLNIAEKTAFANGFEKTGAGNLSFGNASDVTTKINGTITVTAGQINVVNTNRFGTSTNLLMNGGNAGLNSMTLGGLSGTSGSIGASIAGDRLHTWTQAQNGRFEGIYGNSTSTNYTARTNSVIKQGASALDLAGTNVYGGTTTVSAGTLLVNGTHNGEAGTGNSTAPSVVGAGAYTVDASGILGGSGTVTLANDTSMTITGRLSPGGMVSGTAFGSSLVGPQGDIGTFSVTTAGTGEVFFASGSFLTLDIGVGSSSDTLAVTGALNLESGATLDLWDLAGTATGPMTLASFTTITGTFSSVLLDSVSVANPSSFFIDGTEYGLVYGANTIGLVVIPEPSYAFLVAIAGLVALIFRKRRLAA